MTPWRFALMGLWIGRRALIGGLALAACLGANNVGMRGSDGGAVAAVLGSPSHGIARASQGPIVTTLEHPGGPLLCPDGLVAVEEWGDRPAELEHEPPLPPFARFVRSGTFDFGGAAVTISVNATHTAFTWNMEGASTYAGVGKVVVWGVDPANGQGDELANIYSYTPAATSGGGEPLSDNNPGHKIAHVVFCG